MSGPLLDPKLDPRLAEAADGDARRALLLLEIAADHDIDGVPAAQRLLEPTLIYVKPVLALLGEADVRERSGAVEIAYDERESTFAGQNYEATRFTVALTQRF